MKILIRIVLIIVLLLAGACGWLFGLRPLSLLLDHVRTVAFDSQPVTSFGVAEASLGLIQINETPMNLRAPNDQPYPITVTTEADGTCRVTVDGKSITLGPVTDTSEGGRVVVPAPAAHATFEVRRSMLSWPTPLEMNFMTGYAPSWKRHLYYRLTWDQPGGGKLELRWRYEQNYYSTDGWTSGFMTHPGSTGLLSAHILP